MVLEELEDVQITAPEKVVLRCQIDRGRPTAEVAWYRDDKIISDDKGYVIEKDSDTPTLTIAKSKETDSATYRCKAVNKVGEAQTECRVTVVLRTLHFLLHITDYFILQHSCFLCKFYGLQFPV